MTSHGRERTLAQQALALRSVFPQVTPTIRGNTLTWKGVITPTPMARDYTIRITYRLGQYPAVIVIDPPLQPDQDGVLPHFYREGSICLHEASQWDGSMFIADTILPWTAEWLAHYELWKRAGRWHGDEPSASQEARASPVPHPAGNRAQRRRDARQARQCAPLTQGRPGHSRAWRRRTGDPPQRRCRARHDDTPPPAAMSSETTATELGALLKARRRERRLTLRDLSDQIGVSLNTLSRVERGYLPDLKNFQLIIDWLEVPAEHFLQPPSGEISTPEVIARHLRSDQRLTQEAAAKIATLVEEMYHRLAGDQSPALAVHLRSARTFTPAAGVLLADILSDMQSALLRPTEE